jgi:hypothetical protein
MPQPGSDLSRTARFSLDDVRAAAGAAGLGKEGAERLVETLASRGTAVPLSVRFDLIHVLWYAGALIVIGAMGLFTTLAFSAMGGTALTVTALVYGAGFAAAGRHLWYRRGLRTPGGLLVAVAVAMAPLAVFGVQDALGAWGPPGDPGQYRDFFVWINGSWVFMELAGILAGLAALRVFPFPFILAIVAGALWFLSMDLTPWIVGSEDLSWGARRHVSIWFGLAVLVVAWLVDLKRNRRTDFAFWLHLAGLAAFWGGLSLADSSGEIGKTIYALTNVLLIALSVYLMRRAYAVFGAFGISIYLGHLASVVFKDSLLFPFALSLIGVMIIGVGLIGHRHHCAISAWMSAHLPGMLQQLRPPHASLPMEQP